MDAKLLALLDDLARAVHLLSCQNSPGSHGAAGLIAESVRGDIAKLKASYDWPAPETLCKACGGSVSTDSDPCGGHLVDVGGVEYDVCTDCMLTFARRYLRQWKVLPRGRGRR